LEKKKNIVSVEERNESMTFALIGCSRISAQHIKAALNNNMEIVAVCDLLPERIDAILSEYQQHFTTSVRRYTDYRQMLDELKPDIAAITTPSGSHAEIAVYCINKGVNLIIEKPITLSLTDADAIITAAQDKGVKVCACHQNRFNPAIQKIRKAVEAGRFGKLFHGTAHIRWNRGEDYYKQAPWRGTWEQDGGVLMNQCIHNIDLLRWLMGDEITEVFGMTDRLNHDYIEAEDLGLALIRFANNSYGTIEGTTNVYPCNLEETLYIFGEKGTIKAGGKSVNAIEEWRFEGCTETPEMVNQYIKDNSSENDFGHTALYADVIDAVKHDRPVYIDANAGRRALEIVLAIYKSAAEGKSVKLPLKDCSTVDFVGRF